MSGSGEWLRAQPLHGEDGVGARLHAWSTDPARCMRQLGPATPSEQLGPRCMQQYLERHRYAQWYMDLRAHSGTWSGTGTCSGTQYTAVHAVVHGPQCTQRYMERHRYTQWYTVHSSTRSSTWTSVHAAVHGGPTLGHGRSSLEPSPPWRAPGIAAQAALHRARH